MYVKCDIDAIILSHGKVKWFPELVKSVMKVVLDGWINMIILFGKQTYTLHTKQVTKTTVDE